MPVSVNVTETAVPIGAAGTSQQVRNVNATVLINGVPTPVIMQVVLMADAQGNLLDLNITKRQDIELQLLADIRKELMILNDLFVLHLVAVAPLNPVIDLDKEYRRDPSYDYPGI